MSDRPIIIADDDAAFRHLIELTLNRLGVSNSILHAGDGVELLQSLRALHATGAPPPLVFLDVHMPNMTGLQALRTLRNDVALCETVVLMWSDAASTTTRSKAYRLGANAFLAKPATAAATTNTLTAITQFWLETALQADNTSPASSSYPSNPFSRNAAAVTAKHLSTRPARPSRWPWQQAVEEKNARPTIPVAANDGPLRITA